MSQTIAISSSGLKNIVFEKDIKEDRFIFIIGKEKMEIRRFFADFISPRVSRIHQIDPTIDTINFNKFVKSGKEEKINEIITPDVVKSLQQICNGEQIELNNKSEREKLLLCSILLGNEELYAKLNEGHEKEIIIKYLEFNEIFNNEDIFDSIYESEKCIEYISSHFYEIEEDQLLKLPITLFLIILLNNQIKSILNSKNKKEICKNENSRIDYQL